MPWTQRKVKQLLDESKQARGLIEKLFMRDVTCVSDAEDKWAWGQFFDDVREHKQYGVYGTGAGIQVLLMAGHGSQHRYIVGARKVLTEAYTNHTTENRFFSLHHFDLLYKLSSLVEQECADHDRVESPSSEIEDLIRRILPDHGWGDFHNSDSDRDVESKITPTASALLALRKYRGFRESAACENAVACLCRKLGEKARPALYELALGSLALIEYESVKDRILDYDVTKDSTQYRLAQWVKKQKAIEFGADESRHYPTSLDGSRGNAYLFFLPNCLAALVLLKSGAPKPTRRYVLGVTRFFVKEIIDKGGFLSVSRNKVSTVDHLWIYRLLKEIESKQASDLLPQPFYSLSAMPRFARVGTSLGFLLAGSFGVYGLYSALFARQLGESVSIVRVVIFAILATVGLGLFTGTVKEVFKGQE